MILIGVAGKKDSGKGTICKYILQNRERLFGLKDRFGYRVKFDVRIYSMATPIKNFCENVLGLKYEQLYGTQEQKNSLTRYRWEDLPHYPRIIEKVKNEHFSEYLRNNPTAWNKILNPYRLTNIKYPTECMTARQVIQEVGTGIGRQLYKDLWVETAMREVKQDNPDVALFDDIRFPNELDAIVDNGGFMIKLERSVYNDKHPSEIELESKYFYNKSDVIVPEGLGRDESCSFVENELRKLKIVK